MATNNIRARRVSIRQLDLLWEYLNTNRDIATGYNRSLQAKEFSARKWQEIAEILNAQGDGACKDGKAWSKYWVDYKSKLKKRNAAVHASMRQTGGGPSTELPLTDVEERFLQILGEDFGLGLAGIRVDPLPENSVTLVETDPETPVSESVLVQINHEQHPLGQGQEQATIAEQATEERGEELEDLAAEELLTAQSPGPSRRRSRHASMSREDARRLLVQAAQERAAATVRSSAAMEAVQRSLAVIANGIVAIQEDMRDIKRILSNAAGPRAAD